MATETAYRCEHRKAGVLSKRFESPWGYYQVVDGGAGWQLKRICVFPGHRLSYQRHTARSEQWYVVSGAGVATLDGVDIPVGEGSAVEITLGAAHRMANPRVGSGEGRDLVFIEVQRGSYFGEDDIERISDDYDRATA